MLHTSTYDCKSLFPTIQVNKKIIVIDSCKNYDDSSHPQYYLVTDTDIKCWTFDHLKWILGVGIPIGLLCKNI